MKPAVITLWPHQRSYLPLLKAFDPRWAKNKQVILDTALVRQLSPIGLAFTIGALRTFLGAAKPQLKLRAQASILSELKRLGFTQALSSHFEVDLEDDLFAGVAALPLIPNDEITEFPAIIEIAFPTNHSARRNCIDSLLTRARDVLIRELHLNPKKIGNFLYILQELMKNTADHSQSDALLAFESVRTCTNTTINFAYVEYGEGIKKNVERYINSLPANSEMAARAGSRHITEIYRLAFQSGFTTKKTTVNLGKGLHRIASYIKTMGIDMQVFDGSSTGNIAIIGPNPSHKQIRLAFSSSVSHNSPFSFIGSWRIKHEN